MISVALVPIARVASIPCVTVVPLIEIEHIFAPRPGGFCVSMASSAIEDQ
jgi:hypothetical protein